jgi:hypothetical protein
MSLMTAPNTAPTQTHPAVALPAPVAGLLLAIVDGWAPSPPVLPPVEAIRYNGVELSELSSQVRLEGDRLVATLGGPGFSSRLSELLPFPFDGELEGSLVGGATFRGSQVAHVSIHGRADLTIGVASWVVLDGVAPSLWIGRVDGAVDLAFGGNLTIERPRPDGLRLGRARHFRLRGSYTYYVVQTGSSGDPIWHLVVDTDSGAPDEQLLERDFLLLQFAFGRQLRVSALLGVNAERRTVATATGAGCRLNLLERTVCPVPVEKNNEGWVDDAWVPLLFERISAAWTARPEWQRAYSMAFDSYLDAMTLHLDADYLRLQIALEALSYWTLRLGNKEEKVTVKNKEDWKNWVRSNSAAIRSLASEGFEETVYNKVMGVYRLSSGRVVPSAFLAYDTALTPEMSAELEERDVVVHQGIMVGDDYDGEREQRRIAMVRTMLVALIAKTVDYQGAINGWEVGRLGRPVEPHPWWIVGDADREAARLTFAAEEVEPA